MIQKTYHNCGILFMKIGVKYGHNNENIDICIGNQKQNYKY